MSIGMPKAAGLQPVVSLVSIIVLGVVIARYIVEDESLRLPIILFSFFLGIVVAALELRVIVRQSKELEQIEREQNIPEEEVKKRLARFVADLFDEDIPFDELDEKEKNSLSQLEDKNNDFDT
jgi:hypothetical protein